jgi:16S rRNA C1402 (ribose-2'-O) methylase RsmI
MSKLFEQFRTGNLEELEAMLRERNMPVKGEFVVGIQPNSS